MHISRVDYMSEAGCDMALIHAFNGVDGHWIASIAVMAVKVEGRSKLFAGLRRIARYCSGHA